MDRTVKSGYGLEAPLGRHIFIRWRQLPMDSIPAELYSRCSSCYNKVRVRKNLKFLYSKLSWLYKASFTNLLGSGLMKQLFWKLSSSNFNHVREYFPTKNKDHYFFKSYNLIGFFYRATMKILNNNVIFAIIYKGWRPYSCSWDCLCKLFTKKFVLLGCQVDKDCGFRKICENRWCEPEPGN